MKVSKWIKNLTGNKLVRHLKTWYNSVFDFSGKSKVPLLPGAVNTQHTTNTNVQSVHYKAQTSEQRSEVEKVLQIIAHEPLMQAAENVDKYNKYMHTDVKLTSLGLISKKELQGLIYHFINQNRLDGNRQDNVAQLQNELKQVDEFNMSYFSYKQDSTVGQLTHNDILHALDKLRHILCDTQAYTASQK